MSFVARWLEVHARPADDASPLAVEDVTTACDPRTDPDLLRALGHELRRNYVAQEEAALVLEDLQLPSVAAYLRANKYPTVQRIRTGEFGEILTGLLFRQVKRYCVPILKLRWKQAPDQPMHGTDNIGFRFSSVPPLLAVPEVKTATKRSKQIAVRANADLSRILRDRLGPSLAFVYARLASTNPTLASRVIVLLDTSRTARTIERHLVVVHDRAAWRDDVLSAVRPTIKQPTQATIVQIDDLAGLIKAAFDAAEHDLDG